MTTDQKKTKSSVVLKRAFVARNYIFTLNNYQQSSIENILKYFNDQKSQYIFQEEIGESGTPHLQGCVFFKNKISFNTLKQVMPRAHIEKCYKKKASIEYCSKAETAIGKVYTNIKLKEKLIDPLENKTYHNWQQEIIDIISKTPDDRTINWFYDYTGNIGKTSFCKHLCMKHNQECLYLSGKGNDIKYAVKEFIENNNLKIALFDYSRTQENYISYQSIEEIKNGIFFSGKYEGKMCIFNNPHIICFANYPPDEDKLSKDRWYIKDITPNKQSYIYSSDDEND